MSYKRHVERLKRHRDFVLDELLGHKDAEGRRIRPLDDRAINDLVRIAQHQPTDGMPGSTGDGSGVHAEAELTRVEAEVNARLFGKPVFDNVADALRRIDSELAIAAAAMKAAHQARAFIDHVGAKVQGHINMIDLCAECGEAILGRTKRLDGAPYHHPEDQRQDETAEGRCWWKAYNRLRRAS